MEILLAIIAALVGGFFLANRKAQKAEADKKLAESRAKDHVLEEQQAEIEAAIETLDKGIEEAKAKREQEIKRRLEDNMTLKERADRIKKGLK